MVELEKHTPGNSWVSCGRYLSCFIYFSRAPSFHLLFFSLSPSLSFFLSPLSCLSSYTPPVFLAIVCSIRVNRMGIPTVVTMMHFLSFTFAHSNQDVSWILFWMSHVCGCSKHRDRAKMDAVYIRGSLFVPSNVHSFLPLCTLFTLVWSLLFSLLYTMLVHTFFLLLVFFFFVSLPHSPELASMASSNGSTVTHPTSDTRDAKSE